MKLVKGIVAEIGDTFVIDLKTATLNSRLQVTGLKLGYSEGNGALFTLNYEYGELQQNETVDTTKNAGNIAKQTVTFNGLANPFVQTYRYDSLDRITEAIEKVNGTQTWKQTFGYDLYGNRTSRYQIIGNQELPINNITLPNIDATMNRYAGGQGYTFDKNGNITADLANNGRTFIFNGDNKQTQVRNAQNVVIGTYSYDGNGKRVKKVTDTETTIFVYDGLGKLIAEYSTATPPEVPKINYTATDQIGSPRVITDTFGTVESRRDFMPFGEELYADGTYRKSSDDYGNTGQDAVRQRFTGYQRDAETNLDFAEARYYNSGHGRFTAVDPLLTSGKSANPQTFNRYAYANGRPLILIDPTGLQAGKWFRPEGGGQWRYIRNGESTEGYTEITTRNRSGDLVAPGSVNGQDLDPRYVIRLNPDGPMSAAEYLMRASSPLLWSTLTPYNVSGGEVIFSDEYEDTFVEHPGAGYLEGSQMAITPIDVGIFGAGAGFSVTGKAVMESAEALSARAIEIHGALDPIAQAQRTTAIVETQEGTNIVASSQNTLSPAQRAMLGPNEVAATGPGHAEATALNAATREGLTPVRVAPSRPPCPECQEMIFKSGAKAVWPSP